MEVKMMSISKKWFLSLSFISLFAAEHYFSDDEIQPAPLLNAGARRAAAQSPVPSQRRRVSPGGEEHSMGAREEDSATRLTNSEQIKNFLKSTVPQDRATEIIDFITKLEKRAQNYDRLELYSENINVADLSRRLLEAETKNNELVNKVNRLNDRDHLYEYMMTHLLNSFENNIDPRVGVIFDTLRDDTISNSAIMDQRKALKAYMNQVDPEVVFSDDGQDEDDNDVSDDGLEEEDTVPGGNYGPLLDDNDDDDL